MKVLIPDLAVVQKRHSDIACINWIGRLFLLVLSYLALAVLEKLDNATDKSTSIGHVLPKPRLSIG